MRAWGQCWSMGAQDAGPAVSGVPVAQDAEAPGNTRNQEEREMHYFSRAQ